MNKSDFKDILMNIETKFRIKYFEENFLNYMNSLEYGKDYKIKSKEFDDQELLKIINYIDEYKKYKSLSDINLEKLIYKSSRSVFSYPYKEIKGNIIDLNKIEMYISDNIKNDVRLLLEFNDEKHIEEIKKIENNYDKYSYLTHWSFISDDFKDLMKNFKTMDEFLEFIKDNKDYENLYNYLIK
ncbi:hypothetical protein CPT_MarsHill_211 [Staphylococcus phage MarsHill]|nr:hypothetical protein CPT_MarsHill_211 [Staphylococcus phage MarsHill]